MYIIFRNVIHISRVYCFFSCSYIVQISLIRKLFIGFYMARHEIYLFIITHTADFCSNILYDAFIFIIIYPVAEIMQAAPVPVECTVTVTDLLQLFLIIIKTCFALFYASGKCKAVFNKSYAI